MRFFFVTLILCVAYMPTAFAKADSEDAHNPLIPKEEYQEQTKPLMAGSYLASRFAQVNHDWHNASTFIQPLFDSGISKADLIQRAMVLAMGAGQAKKAIALAHKIKKTNMSQPNTIADIFLFAEAFKKKDYTKAQKIFDSIKLDSTSVFIGPFIKSWLAAARGELNVSDLRQNTVQLYHGILISDFLGDHSQIEEMIDHALDVEELALYELTRIADLYAHVGKKDKALDLYNKVLKSFPEDEGIEEKISALKKGTTEPLFGKVVNAKDGMALAFYDIARVLFNEQNDESVRVFAHLAKYVAPKLYQINFLLAEINTRYNQYEKAIDFYAQVPKGNPNYRQAQYEIVDIYDSTEQYDKALKALNRLERKEKDPDTLIRLGDLYRHQNQYKKALDLYNRAIDEMGDSVPEKYWHVYYVRGIAYEQLSEWKLAEQDLKTALKYQPDHPYVLNYLGYSWADKGINLDKATEMIQRAVDAQPSDGYITDSLGWVMYRNKDYKGSVKTLERAVELLPYDPTVNDHLGDAYWKVGRTLEARFQWERAKNHASDEEQIKAISQKLISGLKDEDNEMKKHSMNNKDFTRGIIAH